VVGQGKAWRGKVVVVFTTTVSLSLQLLHALSRMLAVGLQEAEQLINEVRILGIHLFRRPMEAIRQDNVDIPPPSPDPPSVELPQPPVLEPLPLAEAGGIVPLLGQLRR